MLEMSCRSSASRTSRRSALSDRLPTANTPRLSAPAGQGAGLRQGGPPRAASGGGCDQGSWQPFRTTDEIIRIIDQEFFLPFADGPAYKQMRRAAEALVTNFVAAHRDDFERIWETERPFELHLDTAVVSGRADVILDREGGEAGAMAIVDYKTAMDPDDVVHERQLQVYTSAGRREDIDVRAAYLMDLNRGIQRTSMWMRRRFKAPRLGPERRSSKWYAGPSSQGPTRTSADAATCALICAHCV